jgi:hypothetical protein
MRAAIRCDQKFLSARNASRKSGIFALLRTKRPLEIFSRRNI